MNDVNPPTLRELADLRAYLDGPGYKRGAYLLGITEGTLRRRLFDLRTRHGFEITEQAVEAWTREGWLVPRAA